MSKFKRWFKERVPVEAFNYKVPRHANTLLYTLGGITLISFIVLIVTGIILAQFYSPTPEAANSSIRDFLTQYDLGNFIRGLHYWSAQVAIVTVIIHLLRVFFYGSYKKPREVNWLLGVVLFLVMVGLYYTGTILKWDQEAAEALAHAKAAGDLVGPLAAFFSEENGVSLLTRMFSLHTNLLPLILLSLIPAHLLLVKLLGISPLPWKRSKEEEGESTFLVHFKHLIAYGFIAFGLMSIFALILPPTIGPAPVSGVEATKPPWIFMSIFSIENWFGLMGLIVASTLLVIGLLAIPFIDKKPSASLKQRKVIVSIGAILVVLAVVLTINAYITKPEQHIGMGETEQGESLDESKGEVDEESEESEIASNEIIVLNQALVIADEIGEALNTEDIKLAGEKAIELDETIDAIKEKIAAKDQELTDEMGEAIHELLELNETANPDLDETRNNLNIAKEKINAAKALFADEEVSETLEIKVLNQALVIADEIGEALNTEDIKLAGEKAIELDETIDAIKEKIAAKDQELTDEMGEAIHELLELNETANPDLDETRNNLNIAKEKINAAKALFTDEEVKSPELVALENALEIVKEISNALDAGNAQLAGEKATELDEVIDAVGDQLKAKNADLRNELGELIHELGELGEVKNPDINKAKNEIASAEEKIKELINLFQ
ncbi:hypothetical protein BHF71_09545 [Vulcanibacillus modesticaldus]|uniref:Cytochrome b/b6 N-terminal region profile domain-containing protein n=1 Tax=Vulcanibacillus modesticaldus TaxID=337097 RepID=A0A1D2YUA3_9BACI|nr:cytochrome bc complex cytochrome b subunit [Vulcanibacillus modesticaldus]OEF99225.1 hypothetical protein BHF71_09545 [Vulcanibacillus modesticaldus]